MTPDLCSVQWRIVSWLAGQHQVAAHYKQASSGCWHAAVNRPWPTVDVAHLSGLPALSAAWVAILARNSSALPERFGVFFLCLFHPQSMNVDGLTRENVASHLQKYRLSLRKGPDGEFITTVTEGTETSAAEAGNSAGGTVGGEAAAAGGAPATVDTGNGSSEGLLGSADAGGGGAVDTAAAGGSAGAAGVSSDAGTGAVAGSRGDAGTEAGSGPSRVAAAAGVDAATTPAAE